MSETTKGPSEDEIRAVCREIEEMLVAKNTAYGDSALNPMRVFSEADTLEQLAVRADDKLSRISRGHGMADESLRDTRRGLIGYLLLMEVADRRERG